MARQSRRSGSTGRATATANGTSNGSIRQAGALTGRMLVRFGSNDLATCMKTFRRATGLQAASTVDFGDTAYSIESLGGADALVFHRLGVGVIDMPVDQLHSFAASAESGIRAIEPERVVQALGLPLSSSEYLRGYRAAVDHLSQGLLADMTDIGSAIDHDIAGLALDEKLNTWGLQVTNALKSTFTGKGIRLAVLDTGFDLGHPDFTGRTVVSASFVDGEKPQDVLGHGTHCIGTACGSRKPGTLPRYGIAGDAEIYVGKVLANSGFGTDGSILSGIDWAVANGCAVVSMSLGAPTSPGQSFSQIFEQAAERALAGGTLIVAAAGNESARPGFVAPVGHPANCPSIMAVGAVDVGLAVAPFSCGGTQQQGQEVDIAAPGVAVRSSWPRPKLYNTIAGTSMATPHVAGIAALFAEANPGLRGRGLWNAISAAARDLKQDRSDVGAGLVQAP